MLSKVVTDPEPSASILVVEDEVLLRMALAEELRSAGFTVVEARSAEEALVILKTANTIGLVITDIELPDQTDGLRLVSWLRQEIPHVKVILVSRYETTRGGDAKPFNLRALVRNANELLRGTSRGG